MPVWGMAAIFGILGAIAAWTIRRDLAIGVTGDGLYTFRQDTSPVGFAAVIAGKAFVVAFAIAEILYAAGLGDDPMVLLRRLFG
jgi:hypothetical protein